jgi:ABC-type uncharacterized transport system substrate-binding protein
VVAGLGPKHLDLLHELVPTASMIVLLLNPRNPNAHAYASQTQAAADALGLVMKIWIRVPARPAQAAVLVNYPW